MFNLFQFRNFQKECVATVTVGKNVFQHIIWIKFNYFAVAYFCVFRLSVLLLMKLTVIIIHKSIVQPSQQLGVKRGRRSRRRVLNSTVQCIPSDDTKGFRTDPLCIK